MLAVKTSNLKKNFKNNVILEFPNINFSKGKTYVLLGENGSGKSTFIKIILHLIHPTSGKVNILNKSIGYAPERVFLPEMITVDSFLRNLCLLRKMDLDLINQRVPMFLKKWELNGKKSLHQLSKGMIQKVVLIQAMMHYPSCYIFDEPLNGLDNKMQKLFYKEIEYLKKHKKTIIIATHHPQHFLKIADEVITLSKDVI